MTSVEGQVVMVAASNLLKKVCPSDSTSHYGILQLRQGRLVDMTLRRNDDRSDKRLFHGWGLGGGMQIHDVNVENIINRLDESKSNR